MKETEEGLKDVMMGCWEMMKKDGNHIFCG